MPTMWTSYPVEFKGGLVTNMSPLQHGIHAPGSARALINMEPSIEGGYTRIKGFSKFSSSPVPIFGNTRVHGAGQSGNILVVANIFSAPKAGDTFTIEGVSGVYTVATAGVSYTTLGKRATLTLTDSLASSPADKAVVTFNNRDELTTGLKYWNGNAYAIRDGQVFSGSGGVWTNINTPNYGTVLVAGGGQTGSSLAVDGITSDTYVPQVGDTFTIDGVALVYTVTAAPTITSGAGSISINPALDSSPADNAALTFLNSYRGGATRASWHDINFNQTPKLLCADGVNYPFSWDGSNFTLLTGTTDLYGASHIIEYKDHVFAAKGSLLLFSVPFDETDWSVALGAGSLNLPDTITDMIVFREQLIVFTATTIHRVTGTSFADFELRTIADDTGCITSDTAQEIGGDVVYLAPDGVRFLTATERIGDFNLQVASRAIQVNMLDHIERHSSFSSCVIRKKNQYRIFGYNPNYSNNVGRGFLATQFADQESSGLAWGEIRGINAYAITSDYTGLAEVILFSNVDGFIYKMEDGNSFDSKSIRAVFHTPFFSMQDPRVRKTFYKSHTYIDHTGSIDCSCSPRIDFDNKNTIQPEAFTISDSVSSGSYYGEAIYGVATYSSAEKPSRVFSNQLTGSGFSLSLEYNFEDNNPPFTLDALIVEFNTNDRI